MVAALEFVNTNVGTATENNTLTKTVVPTAVFGTTAVNRSYTSTTNVREIRSPTGGIMQFRGLTQSTTNDQYVEVICRGIQPYFMGTKAWENITNASTTNGTETNGFYISCMTGISQCVHDVTIQAKVTTTSLLSTTEHAACLTDPRYMNWRLMTVAMDYGGTISWYRTDSFWDPTSTVIASSWAPMRGGVNSGHWWSGYDNTTITAEDHGKSYAFALCDGSGIQMAHITGGAGLVSVPGTNSTAGTGTNALTAHPASVFSNVSPNRVDQNLCADTNLLLAGQADTSTLASAVTTYSDGYKATITVALEWIQMGAQGGWRGVCMVYYTSQYIQDNTNGSVCVSAIQGTGTSLGSDLASVVLSHVPAATWQPPAKSGAVNPTSTALSDTKYGIVVAPATATTYVYTGGFYASAAWYQPKYASSYVDIARFGKDRYAGAYCMSGAGTTSYFSAPAASVVLTSAARLAAGVLVLGSAVLAM